jgi:sensor histidine kinase regulating citrate/malate metabolism
MRRTTPTWGYIRLSLEANGFSVEDSGVGIPEEQREAMFSRSCAAMNGVARAWGWAFAGAADL